MSDSIALREATFAGKVAVDRQAGLIPGVKILGLESPSKGRSYTPEALRGAIGLYEGRKVFIDHQTDNKQPRSYRDAFGAFEGVRFQEGQGLFGNLRFNPKHADAESLMWWAENMPNGVGMSHDAFGKKADRNGRQVIESITAVNSVDLVANPATNKGLFESTDAQEKEMNLTTLTEAEIQTGNPALHESIVNKATTALRAEVDTLKAENKTLKEAKDAADARERVAARKAKIGELCRDAKFPLEQITPVIEAALIATPDDASMTSLFEGIAKLAPAPGNRPVSKEQRVAEGQTGAGGSGRITESIDSFVAAIK